MDVKNLIDSFKDFFWDILGYFLPGLYLLLLLSSCIYPINFYNSEIVVTQPDLRTFLLMVLAYILGYLIYGIGILKDKLWGKRSSNKKIEAKTQTLDEFKLAKALLEKHIREQKLTTQIDTAIDTRRLRNIIMGFVPEVDNKTYTFMFRSDLCKHMANVSLIVALLGGLNELSNLIFSPLLLFKVNGSYLFLYCILFVSYFVFWQTRNYFYSIALKVPFSAFIATSRNKCQNKNADE